MNLPKITNQQKAILNLLYRHRFLNRVQLQTLMGHKNHKRIILWLNDLRAKQYVGWIYSTDFINKTKPAIYYLSINGVRYIRTLEEHPSQEVRKRYKESSRSQTFIDRCLLIADCCIQLEVKGAGKSDVTYTYESEADYLDLSSDYHFLSYSELIQPQLCIHKQYRQSDNRAGTKDDNPTYLLEIFDMNLPRYRLRNRLKKYVKYLDSREWENVTNQLKPPIILLVCPSLADLIYAKRLSKVLLNDIWELADETRPSIRFTTTQKLTEAGITAEIWEEV